MIVSERRQVWLLSSAASLSGFRSNMVVHTEHFNNVMTESARRFYIISDRLSLRSPQSLCVSRSSGFTCAPFQLLRGMLLFLVLP